MEAQVIMIVIMLAQMMKLRKVFILTNCETMVKKMNEKKNGVTHLDMTHLGY